MVCIRHYTVHIRLSCILIALTFYIDSIIIIIVVDNSSGGGGGGGCGGCTGLSAILLNCSIVSTVSTYNRRHKSLTSNSISMRMKKKEENESILPYYASPFTKQICKCTNTLSHTRTHTHAAPSRSHSLTQVGVRQQQNWYYYKSSSSSFFFSRKRTQRRLVRQAQRSEWIDAQLKVERNKRRFFFLEK